MPATQYQHKRTVSRPLKKFPTSYGELCFTARRSQTPVKRPNLHQQESNPRLTHQKLRSILLSSHRPRGLASTRVYLSFLIKILLCAHRLCNVYNRSRPTNHTRCEDLNNTASISFINSRHSSLRLFRVTAGSVELAVIQTCQASGSTRFI